LIRALHGVPLSECDCLPHQVGGYQLDPCTSCRPPRTFTRPVPCAVEDQASAHHGAMIAC
jgi:hypothetical protein